MRKPNSAGLLPFLMHRQYIAENYHAGLDLGGIPG